MYNSVGWSSANESPNTAEYPLRAVQARVLMVRSSERITNGAAPSGGLTGGAAEVDLPGLMALLAAAGEHVSSEPETAEAELRGIVSGARSLLGLGHVGLRAEVSDRRVVECREGETAPGSEVEEVPVLRGKTPVGALRASSEKTGSSLTQEQLLGLRSAAAWCALVVGAARARDLAAARAAHVSAVQVASEALGAILDEGQLYGTVLVLTLELLEASGGAVFFGGEPAASLGLDDEEEVLRQLGRVEIRGHKPWTGGVGRYCALGVPVGRDGTLFLVRVGRAYGESEGTTLKLVARQLARARERGQLYAAKEKTTLDAILALAAALESRDGTTGEHIRRTQRLAEEVAVGLGLPPERVRDTRYAAVLHDVGKIGIPDAILNKPGKLDEAEWGFMRRHPEIGADILGRVEGFEKIADVALTHHERFDGRGYPAGLSGEDIPIEARVVSVVDTYDAMTNDRPYRRALSDEEAVAELVANAGSQFDPGVVEAMRAVLQRRRGERP